MITQEQLKEVLDYNPKTGIFIRRIGSGRNKAGQTAGCINKYGYIQIGINNKIYRAHQLAFLYMNGYIPKEIDHKDTNRSNNKWINLRKATRTQNFANREKPKNNTSGYKGVVWDKQSKKWRSQIYINYKCVVLGTFYTKEEAAEAYNKAALTYHGKFARLNVIKE